MSKSHWTRKNILLTLMIIWNLILILFYWKPYLLETISLKEHIKYEIIGGYVSKQFIEENIYYHFALFCISITCMFFESLSIIVSFKNIKYIKFISIGIYIQTILSMLLGVWKKYFVDSYNKFEIIDFKIWIIVSIIICLTIIIASKNTKTKHVFFYIATILQIVYTMSSLKTYSLNNIYTIFECTNGIVIYILYWILITTKSEKGEN